MKPILFSTPMVQAILDGRKTMTRRVVKIPYPHYEHCEEQDISIFLGAVGCKTCGCYHWDDAIKQKYQVGDVIWVRETWTYGRVVGESDEYGNSEFWIEQTQKEEDEKCIFYKADMDEAIREGISFEDVFWKPSIYMPKEYARIFLRVTNVRVERLQDISVEYAIKEGIKKISHVTDCNDKEVYLNYLQPVMGGCTDPIYSFYTLWNSINGKGAWEENPFVFVYEFQRIEKPN